MSKKKVYTTSDHVVAIGAVIILLLIVVLIPIVWGTLLASVPLIIHNHKIIEHPLFLFNLFWQPVLWSYIVWVIIAAIMGKRKKGEVVGYLVISLAFSLLTLSKYPSEMAIDVRLIIETVASAMIFALPLLKLDSITASLERINKSLKL